MQMTIGKRITFGFGIIILILIVLGSFGYYTSTVSEEGFKSYRTMAIDTNLTGRIQANILSMRVGALDFFKSGSENSSIAFWSRDSKTREFLQTAQGEITDPERAKMIDEISATLGLYTAHFKTIEGYYVDREKLVNGEAGINKVGPQIEKAFTEVMTSANKDQDSQATFYTAEALRTLLLARIRVLRYLDDNSVETKQQAQSFLSKLNADVARLKQEIQNPHRQVLLAEAMKMSAKYVDDFNKITTLIEARNKLIDEMKVFGEQIADKIEKIKLSIKTEQDQLGPEMVKKLNHSKIFSIIVSLIATLAGIFLSFIIIRSITNVLTEITGGLRDSSDQVYAAAQELASSAETLASGASEQASTIEETSASLEEITGMVKNNVASAENGVIVSNEVKAKSELGNISMEKIQKAMEEILKSNEQIENLVRVIGNIGAKTQIMDEIVFQTKLLSFNASVEAERAGEHGRGFAVVAQEVGNLAQMSGKSAQEIAAIVSDSIKEAEIITTANKKKVEEGSSYVLEAAKILSEIMTSAVTVTEGSNQILSASKEQSTGISQINMAISQLDKATQENAAAAEQTASSSEELNAQAKNLQGMVRDLTALVTGRV